VLLSEHSDLRRALSLDRTPDFTTFYRFMQRLDAWIIRQALREAAFQVLKDLPNGKTVFAVDATGLAPGTTGTFFIKRKRGWGQGLPWRYWLKWVVVVETKHQLLLAQIAKRDP